MNSDFKIHKVESMHQSLGIERERRLSEDSPHFIKQELPLNQNLPQRMREIAFKCFSSFITSNERALPEYRYKEIHSSQDFQQYFKMMGLPKNEEFWTHLRSNFDHFLAEIKKRQAS